MLAQELRERVERAFGSGPQRRAALEQKIVVGRQDPAALGLPRAHAGALKSPHLRGQLLGGGSLAVLLRFCIRELSGARLGLLACFFRLLRACALRLQKAPAALLVCRNEVELGLAPLRGA